MYCFENGKLRDLDMNFDDLVDDNDSDLYDK